MQRLIPLINEIHDILDKSELGHELKLPQVVVIGSQSVGKSSVLESIIGREFLPRGKGIVTRRPIEIQLSNTKHQQGGKDWCEIFDRKGEKFYDFEEVKQIIQEETDKMCGQNKGVVKAPLRLKIFSQDVVDLLLVDLPGMTKNPVGDQPQDIEKKIMELLEPYVTNPNSIILAVSRGSDDLANSESLKLARYADPNGNRTIGVITQLDLLDDSSDALNDLQGQTYPLKLGYVGVVMRGTKDMTSKSIQEQIKQEKMFFENSEIYKRIADKMGIRYLVKSLNLHFMNHIKKCLPSIRDNLIKMIQLKEHDLKQYGEYDELEDNKQRGLFILNMLSKFSQAYKDLVEGKYLKSNHDQLLGGSRINFIFGEIFRKSLNDIDPFDILSDDEIRTAIRNANGLRPSLFVPEGAFENLVKQQISRLLQPSLQCSKLVYEEQRRILNMISIQEIERFDNLSNKVSEVMENVLSRCLVPTDQMIKNLVEIELGYINTSHPDFCGGITLLQSTSNEVFNKQSEDKSHLPSDAEKKQQKNKTQQGGGVNVQQHANSHHLEQGDDHSLSENKSQMGKNSAEDPENGFWSWLPFSSRQQQSKQTELMDSKLQKMALGKKKSTEDMDRIKFPELMHAKSYNEDYSINNLDQFMPKSHLPNVPSQIKLGEHFSRKEQTETKMIKNLIVSYFNVVKKNINDSVPKTIISFLTNRSVNICERELVSNLYKEDQFETLLQENDFIIKQRQETKKHLNMLRLCLNALNDTELKI